MHARVTTYRMLESPLAQIVATSEFVGSIEAFIADIWQEMYTDPAPDLDLEVETVLEALTKLGLRFERSSADEESTIEDNHWNTGFQGGPFDALISGWMHKVLDELALDIRAMHDGLFHQNLIFVPDPAAAAREALVLYQRGEMEELSVKAREDALWKAVERLSIDRAPIGKRGTGPHAKGAVLADRIVIALQRAKAPMSPEDIAAKIGHANLASVTAALHKIVTHGAPKRLAGWIRRATPAGTYELVRP